MSELTARITLLRSLPRLLPGDSRELALLESARQRIAALEALCERLRGALASDMHSHNHADVTCELCMTAQSKVHTALALTPEQALAEKVEPEIEVMDGVDHYGSLQ